MNSRVMLDCERMKYPFTGLYYYCLHLGRALLQQPQAAPLSLYLPPSIDTALFGADVPVVRQDSLHKFFFPDTQPYGLWHCTYQGSNYFPPGRKLKIVLSVHDLNFLHDEHKPLHRKKAYMKSLAAKVARADAVITISEFVKKELLEHVPAAEDKLQVVYNGCNMDDSIEAAAPKDAPRKPFFFTIGTIVAKKNFHVLPATLPGNDYELVIAGIVQDADYKKKIIARAEALGVQDRLRFAGTITEEEKRWYLQNCSLFLFPSLAEGFGLPVVEAMHLGRPVLLSDKTSLPEIGGPYAGYWRNFDETQMAEVCRQTMADFSPKKSAAIKAWAARFTWKAAAEAHWKIYNDVLHG